MNGLLGALALALCVGIIMLVPGVGAAAVLLAAGLGTLALLIIYQTGVDRRFLLQFFTIALLLRLAVGTLTFIFRLQEFFGGDALAYDEQGNILLRVWRGELSYNLLNGTLAGQTFYGMPYLVASIYAVVGRNMLAVQFVNAVLGALTILPVYLCAQHIFENKRVARTSALLVTFFPSLVLWSAQGLKDAPIIFLLALAMLATLRLCRKLSLGYIVLLVGAMLGLLSMRFYIFYMVAAAAAGAFVIGQRSITIRSFAQQFIVIICVGLMLVQFGVLRSATQQYETFGSLEAINRSRLDLTRSAESGFGKDVDVSTTSGALSAIPLGLLYLLFAPFPWQVVNLRQLITLPEMLAWWGSFPLLVLGLWFTLKYRLRPALPILLFTTMLTLGYSIFQGNVGTAYRQRAQLLIFYFMFVAVGYVLLKERNEERREQQRALRQRRPWA
jgi:4-amino-4-deoxy-L-arabinose transferase-like glycosyltransferase